MVYIFPLVYASNNVVNKVQLLKDQKFYILRKNAKKMKKGIESIYGGYDYCFIQPEKILKLLNDEVTRTKRNQTILSIGCGEGRIEEKFVKDGHTLVGVDINEEALKKARERGITVICGDFLNISFKEQFDCVIAVDVFEHLVQPHQFLQKIADVLKEEGKLIIKSPNFGHIYYRLKYVLTGSLGTYHQLALGHFLHCNLNEVKKMLQECGFSIEQVHYFTYYPILFNLLAKIHPNLFSVSTFVVSRKKH